MDLSKHRNHWINIQRMIKAKCFLLHAMKSHLDPPLAIQRSPSIMMFRSIDTWSRLLILRRPFIGRLRPNSTSLNVVLRDGRSRLWIFIKFNLCRPSIHVLFDSLYSWLISASKHYLKSKFDKENKEISHLELQFLSSETQNERPCIRRLIGSFQRLIWVRLRVFILVFHHLVLILHFK